MSIWMEHDETDWKDDCADLDVVNSGEIIYVDEIGAVGKVYDTISITLKFNYPTVYTIDLFYDDLGIYQHYSKGSDEVLTDAIEYFCEDGIVPENMLNRYFDVEKQGNSLVGIEKSGSRFAQDIIEEYCDMCGAVDSLITNFCDGDSFEEYWDDLDSYDKETVAKAMTEEAGYTLVKEGTYDNDLVHFDTD